MPLEWNHEKRKVSELKELPNNPRKIDKNALEKLKQRIAQRGFHDVVKVDTDGFILSGNQRKRALTELGIEEVNILVPSRPLERSERDAVILESNRNDGEWDLKILSDNFEMDILKNVGFTDKELGIFESSTIGDSGRLDEVGGGESKVYTCPACKHSWTPPKSN